MNLPVTPPVLPMLAKRADDIPTGDQWIFEPKWDGFRTIVFRQGEELFIQSREGKPLDRYFPELHEPLKAQLPESCVLDGEIVIAGQAGLNFDALQLRVHPAASRIKLLSQQTPASIVFFDLLALDGTNLMQAPFLERRDRLSRILKDAAAPLHQTPATRDRRTAEDWFSRFEGAGLDGVMAKAENGTYQPDKRTMIKVKHERECDCLVAGFRWHKTGSGTDVGSLLLGLYNNVGSLQHVGVCSSFTAVKRRELVGFLEPYRANAMRDHPWAAWAEASVEGRMPGGKSRWTGGKDLSWEPLRPELVVQVAYEHMQGDRFRHLAHFRRWRPDKQPESCTYAQLEIVPPQELMDIFG